MMDVAVAEVSVDAAGRLLVFPHLSSGDDFVFIWRAAAEISWDPQLRALVAPAPREWGYPRWFQQIVRAVGDEYGVRLRLDQSTSWLVSSELKAAILAVESWGDSR